MVCTGQWQCFACCMTCGAHGCVLWQPLCPMLGGPLCKNQQYVSHKKYFVPSWGTNVCCQKDLCGKVSVEILRFGPPPIWAKMAATARTHGHATSHATCKASPLHHVAMTPAQPTGHWVGLHWGCCANNARFLCFWHGQNIVEFFGNVTVIVAILGGLAKDLARPKKT